MKNESTWKGDFYLENSVFADYLTSEFICMILDC